MGGRRVVFGQGQKSSSTYNFNYTEPSHVESHFYCMEYSIPYAELKVGEAQHGLCRPRT